MPGLDVRGETSGVDPGGGGGGGSMPLPLSCGVPPGTQNWPAGTLLLLLARMEYPAGPL